MAVNILLILSLPLITNHGEVCPCSVSISLQKPFDFTCGPARAVCSTEPPGHWTCVWKTIKSQWLVLRVLEVQINYLWSSVTHMLSWVLAGRWLLSAKKVQRVSPLSYAGDWRLTQLPSCYTHEAGPRLFRSTMRWISVSTPEQTEGTVKVFSNNNSNSLKDFTSMQDTTR
jgi:hypothetical protein